MEESPGASLEDFMRWMANEPIGPHLNNLYQFALSAPGNVVLELGTQNGISTVMLVAACRKKGGRLFSVDIDPCLLAIDRIRDWDFTDSWTFIQADDRDINAVSAAVPMDKIGMIFVDTSHEKEHTAKEIELYAPFILDGGFMAFHDTYLLNEYWPGVSDPIAEFLDGNDEWRTVYSTMDSHGLTVLEKNGARKPAAILP